MRGASAPPPNRRRCDGGSAACILARPDVVMRSGCLALGRLTGAVRRSTSGRGLRSSGGPGPRVEGTGWVRPRSGSCGQVCASSDVCVGSSIARVLDCAEPFGCVAVCCDLGFACRAAKGEGGANALCGAVSTPSGGSSKHAMCLLHQDGTTRAAVLPYWPYVLKVRWLHAVLLARLAYG